jgi:hypothetical protein
MNSDHDDARTPSMSHSDNPERPIVHQSCGLTYCMMNRLLIGMVAALSCAGMGCRSMTSTDSTIVADSVHLAYGASAVLRDAPVTLAFQELVEDSRCSPDLECPAAGRLGVVVRIDVDGPGRGYALLEFSTPDAPTHAFSGYQFRLINALSPPASSEPPVPAQDYWIAIRVTRPRD